MKAIILNLSAWAILPFMDTIAKYLSAELYLFFKLLGLDIFLLFFGHFLLCLFSLEKN